MKRIILTILVLCFVLSISAVVCFANAETPEEGIKNTLGSSIRYIGAALSIGLCALATGIAQSRIGAAGMASIVEKPETTGTVIICIAIPETMVILGFVVAAMIIIF